MSDSADDFSQRRRRSGSGNGANGSVHVPDISSDESVKVGIEMNSR